jgi:hypothetical protein
MMKHVYLLLIGLFMCLPPSKNAGESDIFANMIRLASFPVTLELSEHLPIENMHLIEDEVEDVFYFDGKEGFTPERFYQFIVALGLPNPEVIYRQAVLESGNFTSRIWRQYNNPFGMNFPSVRPTTASGRGGSGDGIKAKYNSWEESILDYQMWMIHFQNLRRVKMFSFDYENDDHYYKFLGQAGYCGLGYSEYKRRLKNIELELNFEAVNNLRVTREVSMSKQDFDDLRIDGTSMVKSEGDWVLVENVEEIVCLPNNVVVAKVEGFVVAKRPTERLPTQVLDPLVSNGWKFEQINNWSNETIFKIRFDAMMNSSPKPTAEEVLKLFQDVWEVELEDVFVNPVMPFKPHANGEI